MAQACIDMLYKIMLNAWSWWLRIITAVGLTRFWVGTVVLVLFFTIVILPLRGGHSLPGGAIGAYTHNKIHSPRGKNKPKDSQKNANIRKNTDGRKRLGD